MIKMTHAIIYPWTVMIHFHDTPANESFSFELTVSFHTLWTLYLVQFFEIHCKHLWSYIYLIVLLTTEAWRDSWSWSENYNYYRRDLHEALNGGSWYSKKNTPKLHQFANKSYKQSALWYTVIHSSFLSYECILITQPDHKMFLTLF